ncbi:hypothetical protein B0H10DRAFT_2012027 [Mycena sp. CBHHK59/15]|nr:hypothetical protein B0H10DRAFT_2012027 [Mycena sp. CBHHK59/15]
MAHRPEVPTRTFDVRICFWQPELAPMNPAALVYKLTPHRQAVLGEGACSVVFKATEEGSSTLVAIKKLRVSKRVQRPTLQHEARILQLLKDHAIPVVYGYGHLKHFEYMAMEVLRPSLLEMQKDGGLSVATVIRVVDQTVRTLRLV